MSTPDNIAGPFVGSRSALAIFCEEVRHEITGQTTLIGVFGDAVRVPSFPTTLPRLAVCLYIWSAHPEPFKSLGLKLLLNEIVLQEFTFDPNTLADAAQKIADLGIPSHEKRTMLRLNFEFAPFVVDSESVLRVRINADGAEIRPGALKFRLLDEQAKSI
jgi:hypothetical protein